jgi:NHLM bacteriocin system ABC transporter ATP-binding protein
LSDALFETASLSRIESFFRQHGVEEHVAGNTPFLLDAPDTVWLVTTGRVDVFSVTVRDGRPEGSRHHFFTADKGDVLFGVDQEQYGNGQGFLAVGIVGTRLLRLRLSILQAAARRDGVDGLESLIDRWVLGLSSGSSRSIFPHPRPDAVFEAGERGDISGDKRFTAHKGVIWIGHESGASLFLGMEEPSAEHGTRFPITVDTWMQALGPAVVNAASTRAALSDDSVWQGLEIFYATLFQCEFFNIGLAAADELNRLQEKTQRDQRVTQAALDDLASLLSSAGAAPRRETIEGSLLMACRIVGERMGFSVKSPPRPREGEVVDNPVREIARASKLRVRQVTLTGDWWRRETTPLVAFLAESQQPVALLPDGRRMLMLDPTVGVERPVTAIDAPRLSPIAYVFSPPFPDKALGPWDIFRFGAARERRDFFITLLVGLGTGVLAMLTPFFMGLLVDSVLPDGSRSGLLMMGVILAAVGISTTLFDTVRALGSARLQIKLSASVEPAMWDRLLNLPVSFFRRFTAGDLFERVSYVDEIRRILTGATVDSLMTGIFSGFLFLLLFYYSGKLALVATGLVLVALTATSLALYLKLQLQRSIIRLQGQISGLVLQLLTGIAKLRVSGAEGRAFSEWAKAFAQQKRLELRTARIEALLEVFSAAFPVVSSLCLFTVMISLTQEAARSGTAQLSTGDFIAFNSAFATFIAESQRLAVATLSVLSVIPLFERAKPILAARPEVDLTRSDPGELSGLIEIDHLSFRYDPDGPPVLDNVTMKIRPGEFVAIVGPSGSGKSTLLRLLLGLEAPETGSIYYDGRDLQLLDVQRLRRRIGVVMQNAQIRQGTIFENIVGAGPYSIEDAWTAARMAGFDDELKAMPMGLHTVVQQGGATLSGGQRQRLTIARAIVSRPRMIFFDEATSALDNRTQAVVSQSLHDLQATRLAIAHRLSTVTQADRIFVLQAGRIVQTGTYQELASQEGTFLDLMKRQLL